MFKTHSKQLSLFLVVISIALTADAEAASKSTVTVKGIGMTVLAARLDAFRKAVQRVVGTLLDAKSVVKNQRLIQDKILTYSAGHILKSDTLSEKKKGMIWYVKIRAVVKIDKLKTMLRSLKVLSVQVDGSSLAAQLATMQHKKKSGKAMILNAMLPFRGALAKVISISKPKLKPTSFGFLLVYDIQLGINRRAYDNAAAHLLYRLKKIAVRQVPLRVCRDHNRDRLHWKRAGANWHAHFYIFTGPEPSDCNNAPVNAYGFRLPWGMKGSAFGKGIPKSQSQKALTVAVKLLDREGKVLLAKRKGIYPVFGSIHFRWYVGGRGTDRSRSRHLLIITPFKIRRRYYNTTWVHNGRLRFTFKVKSPALIGRIARAEVIMQGKPGHTIGRKFHFVIPQRQPAARPAASVKFRLSPGNSPPPKARNVRRKRRTIIVPQRRPAARPAAKYLMERWPSNTSIKCRYFLWICKNRCVKLRLKRGGSNVEADCRKKCWRLRSSSYGRPFCR